MSRLAAAEARQHYDAGIRARVVEAAARRARRLRSSPAARQTCWSGDGCVSDAYVLHFRDR